jgi:hypothetical protein
MIEKFMIEDRAFYCGDKHPELNGKVGWIHAKVNNQDDTYIVFYPDTKNQDSYVISAQFLTKYRPSKAELNDGPIIQPRRQRSEDLGASE